MKSKLILLSLPFLALAGCDNVKVDEDGQTLDRFFSKYSIKVSSNSDKLFFSADIDKNEYLTSGEAGILKPGVFINVAHYEFSSYQDVEKLESWYFQIENKEDARKFPIESFHYTSGEVERYYIQQITFKMKIEEEVEIDHEYNVSLESISFPEVNVFSLLFVGNAGYQERLSDGNQIGGNEILSHVKSNEISELKFFIYLNGNDPLVTNENFEYIENNQTGLFDIRIKVSEDL